MITDETLYRRYLDGDEDSLHLLMERHGDALTLYIAGYIHDLHDAEDLMLDAFLRVITKRPHLLDGCLKSYLYKTARHLALRFAARQRRSGCFSLDDLETEPEGELLVERIVQTAEQHHILHLSMTKLHAEYHEALYLLYFEEMSYREIARIMGKNEKQIDNLVQRGKLALRQLLEKEGITHA